MLGKQHAVIGGVCGIATGVALVATTGADLDFAQAVTKTPVIASCVIASVVGSLIVDIDSKRSIATQKFNQIFTGAMWFGLIALLLGMIDVHKVMGGALQGVMGHSVLVMLLILLTVGKMSPHRQFTHKVVGTFLICSCVLYLLPLFCGIAFTIGYISHIVADKTTPAGLDFFDIKLPFQTSKGKFKVHF